MKKLIILAGLLFSTLFTFGQTTYTVTQNSCGNKNLGYCSLPVTDDNNVPYLIVVDHRSNSQGPIDTLSIETPIFPYTTLYTSHAAFAGFVTAPPSTTDVFGVLTVDTDDGQVHAGLEYRAHYVFTCSGRGCAGPVIGWHYFVQSGSTITKQP